MNKVTVSFTLGLILGLLIAPLVLAGGVDQSQTEPEWCFRERFDSKKHFENFRNGDVGEEFDDVFIKLVGRKHLVYTRCEATPLPHRYGPL